MFEATFIQSTVFRQIVEALKDIVTDVNIECTANGIKAQAMEPSHISLASLRIAPEAFDSYRCDRNIVLGLNITSVSKILKCLDSGDSLSLSSEDNADTVNFCISSKKLDKISNFELKLYYMFNYSQDDEADTEISLPSSKFGQICKDLINFGDTVKIVTSKTSVDFVAEGSLGTAKITILPTADAVEDDEKESGGNAQPLSKQLTIHLSNSSPLCVECKLHGGDWGHLKYYLAPKIE
ncbi:hypothetical protein MXB_4328 [Myxobolus squamalis]|nr:hypothetical protein MXB_4328 [Myxobolus squamalis]